MNQYNQEKINGSPWPNPWQWYQEAFTNYSFEEMPIRINRPFICGRETISEWPAYRINGKMGTENFAYIVPMNPDTGDMSMTRLWGPNGERKSAIEMEIEKTMAEMHSTQRAQRG